jgi:hypothetical protein
MRASSSLRKETVGSSPATGIFLYVAPTGERVLAVAFGRDYSAKFASVVWPFIERVPQGLSYRRESDA